MEVCLEFLMEQRRGKESDVQQREVWVRCEILGSSDWAEVAV